MALARSWLRPVLVGLVAVALVSGCLGVREGHTAGGLVSFGSEAEFRRGRAEADAVLMKAQALVAQVAGGHGVSTGEASVTPADLSLGSRMVKLDNTFFVRGVAHSADFASWSGKVRDAWVGAGWKAKVDTTDVYFRVTTKSGVSMVVTADRQWTDKSGSDPDWISVDYETELFRVPKSVADKY